MSPDSFYLSGETVAAQPYRYRACGLEGIYLLNGYSVETYDGEEYVSVTDVDGLHKAIGRHLVAHRKALAPQEIRFLRNTLDLTQAELAERLGNTSQSVARWEKGICEMPGAAEKLLRALFLVSVMESEEFEALRTLLSSSDLDRLDELTAPSVQFELYGSWTEREAA